MYASLIWLALGGLLHTFGFGLWTIPLAAWFVPLFMLRFSRRTKPLAGVLGIWLAFYIGTCIANSGYMPVMPNGLYFIVMGLFSAFYVLPYLADRLIADAIQDDDAEGTAANQDTASRELPFEVPTENLPPEVSHQRFQADRFFR